MKTFQQETNTEFLSFRAIKLQKSLKGGRTHQKKNKKAYFDVVLDQFRKNCKVIAATRLLVPRCPWGWPLLSVGQRQVRFSLGKAAQSCRHVFSPMPSDFRADSWFSPVQSPYFQYILSLFYHWSLVSQRTVVLNNHQGRSLETGLQKREMSRSQSSKWTNERFHTPSWNRRDAIFTKDALWSCRKLQQEFSTRGNRAQRNRLICWGKIKPSLAQTPKPTAWLNSYRSNQREK